MTEPAASALPQPDVDGVSFSRQKLLEYGEQCAHQAALAERERLARVCEGMKASPEEIAKAGKSKEAANMILGNVTLDFCAGLIRKG